LKRVIDFNNSIIPELRDQNISLSLINITHIRDKLEKHGTMAYRNLLTEWERSYLDNLRVLKRRCDFLSGRLAAKKAIKDYLNRNIIQKLNHLKFNDIEIRRLKSGKPAIFIDNKLTKFLISISHSGPIATSIVCDRSDYKGIGIDIEKIERREESFFNVAFNQNEITRIKDCKVLVADKSKTGIYAEATRFWVIKESILKSLGIGLNVDLKDIEIIDPRRCSNAIQIKEDVKRRFKKLQLIESDIMFQSFMLGNLYVISISYMN